MFLFLSYSLFLSVLLQFDNATSCGCGYWLWLMLNTEQHLSEKNWERDLRAPPPQTLTQQKTQNAAQQKTEIVDRMWSRYKWENVRNKNSGYHQEMEKCIGNEGGTWQRGKEKSTLHLGEKKRRDSLGKGMLCSNQTWKHSLEKF